MITLKKDRILLTNAVALKEIAYLEENSIVIIDPLYHEPSKSLGIDKDLFGEKFKYNLIQIEFLGKWYFTTRSFFLSHKRWYKNSSRRDAFYLEIKLFGLKRAYLFDDYVKNLETSQQDFFAVMANDNKAKRDKLFKSYEAVEKYNSFIKERKVIL